MSASISRLAGSGSGSEDGLEVAEVSVDVSVDVVVVGVASHSYTSKSMPPLRESPPHVSRGAPGQGRLQTPLAASVLQLSSISLAQ
jgi:hypothetical protein